MKPYIHVAKTEQRTKKRAFLQASYRAIYYVLLAGGVFGLGYAGYVIADTHAYQASEQSRFEAESRNGARHNVDWHPADASGAIGEMEVPRLGLKAIFVQGDSPKILRRAVGHISETALPGEWGNVVLTGHRDTFFRPLRNIQKGDEITLKTLEGNFQYQVESTAVVPPSDIRVLQPTNTRMLTLITCFPFYYVGPAPNRFIVRARQVGLPAE